MEQENIQLTKLNELKEKYSSLEQKYIDLKKESTAINKEMQAIDKCISLAYEKEFINSNKNIEEIYFIYYGAYCKIIELTGKYEECITTKSVLVRENESISIVTINASWREIFENRISKSEFEEKYKKTMNTLNGYFE